MMDARSEKALTGVHPDLVRVARRAYSYADGATKFIVTEGLRTKTRQQQLFDAGATRTLNSRHLTGHAVDIAATVNSKVRWDWPLYQQLASVMKVAADEEGVSIG